MTDKVISRRLLRNLLKNRLETADEEQERKGVTP